MTNDPKTRFWHGFADMHVVADREVVIASGDGAVITDTRRQRLHRRHRGALVLQRRATAGARSPTRSPSSSRSCPAIRSFGAYTTDATLRVADRLASMAPFPNAVVFLASGGSDASTRRASLPAATGTSWASRTRRCSCRASTATTACTPSDTSLVGMPAMRNGYGGEPFVTGRRAGPGASTSRPRPGCSSSGATRSRRSSASRSSAPAASSRHRTGTGTAINDLCRRYDVLLIADEVITGFGRMGRTWGSERFGIEPDLITFAKGVTSGYMPLGGVLVGERVRAPFWDDPVPGAIFRHGYTYSGHSGAAAAAMANLDIIEREGLIERVADARAEARGVGSPARGLRRWSARSASVGLTAAVSLAPAVLERDPTAPDKVVAAALRHGVATRVLRAHAIHISPPFVITEDQIDADGRRHRQRDRGRGRGRGAGLSDPVGVAAPATIAIRLVVNGRPVALEVEPRRLLVDLLREDLDLTGAKIGCDTSQCGTCTVHLDGAR